MRGLLAAIALLTVASALIGCEENLTAREHFDDVPFTLYGVLSPDLDTQSVRVYPPEDFPTLGFPEPLELDLTSTDLQTGERRTWQDSVLVDSAGRYEHVFWATFRTEFDREYRVEAVRRSDGARSHADVRIPAPVTVRIDEQDAPLLDVFIEGDDFRVLKPEAVYDVSKFDLRILRYEVAYEGREQPVEQGWQVTFNLIVDAFEVNYLYNGHAPALGGICRVDFVYLRHLELHALIGDAAWDPPGGIFDPNVQSQPGHLSNVENGFGFIGGGYRIVVPLHPSRETVESSCLRYGF